MTNVYPPPTFISYSAFFFNARVYRYFQPLYIIYLVDNPSGKICMYPIVTTSLIYHLMFTIPQDEKIFVHYCSHMQRTCVFPPRALYSVHHSMHYYYYFKMFLSSYLPIVVSINLCKCLHNFTIFAKQQAQIIRK